ncbi:unnamed protein product [Linum tenue]|uniref:Transmembrane protein n=1 Tax=Linum tenue TaxID=586396 RepID=A0AAV0R1K1_9ROSI|nr:unnamed protein product [Linum tenue]
MSLKLLLILLFALTSIAAAQSATAAEPSKETSHLPKPTSDPPAAEPTVGETREGAGAGEGEGQRKKHIDKSVAGGGVIIGGLLTAVCMAVFCYIRVTRKRDDELPMFVNGKSTDALALERQSVTSSPSSH